ncbi:MAG: hypothetical protein ACOX7U_06845 [Desulfitobacteriia bacterium]|jgi:uncharacterized membrane protein YkvI
MGRNRKLSALPIATAFIGTVVGAGFATGQEVFQFFTIYGRKGFLGIILCTALFCYFGLIIMRTSRTLNASSHRELVELAGGPHLGRLLDWFITLSFLGVLVVMAAGSGALAEEYINLPPLYGSLAIIILSFLTVISGVDNVIRAIGMIVPFLLVIVFSVTILSIFKNPVTIQKLYLLEALKPAVSNNWFFSAFIYVSFNLLLAIAILAPLGVQAQNNKALAYGGILGGVGLGMGVLAISFAVLSGIPETLSFQVPMIFLASRLNPAIAFLYGLVLFLEIYSTAVSILYGFVARVANSKGTRFFWATLACGGALFASRLGFSRAITTIYPLLGLIGLVFLASLVCLQAKEPLQALLKILK